MKRHILIILDGYGIAEDPFVSAIDHAKKPFLDHLFSTYPHGTLQASGLAVGLPEGQMGNSEVGHMNLGAGRIVYQDITRIDKEIADGTFNQNEVLNEALARAKKQGVRVHLLGLLSNGGVHSSIDHLKALIELAADEGLASDQVFLHACMDGRDTGPETGAGFLTEIGDHMEKVGVGRIGTVIGRYYAMDRDRRWERIKLAYDLFVRGEGTVSNDPVASVITSYREGITDEFLKPIAVDGVDARIRNGDVVICFNFRADRMRQICETFLSPNFEAFKTEDLTDLHLVTFSKYEASFNVPVVFPKINLTKTLGEVLADAGCTQLRAAETEKYPHVTYFFSGGREETFAGEERLLVASPKVATYDLQPEMSAPELGDRVAKALAEERFSFVVLNFANPDMVGHTGDFDAAVKAVEAVDAATRVVVKAALRHGYSIEIIADHGNADKMRNPDGSQHTAHTTALVPHLIIKDGFDGFVRPGKLGDVAPTILTLMELEIPSEMTGEPVITL